MMKQIQKKTVAVKKWNNPGSRKDSEYHQFYNSWNNMIKRSGNKTGRHPSYSDVTVCERWLSYDNFFEDMSSTWWKGSTLDKDSIKLGNHVYCPEFCKWISKSENSKERIKRIGNPSKDQRIIEKNKGANNYKARKVQCIETGEIFFSTADAARKYNLRHNAVCNAANPNNSHKTAGGYHWIYI